MHLRQRYESARKAGRFCTIPRTDSRLCEVAIENLLDYDTVLYLPIKIVYSIRESNNFWSAFHACSLCILQLVIFTLCWGRHLHYRHCGALVVTHTGVRRWRMSKRQMSCQLKALKAGSPHGQTGGPTKSVAGRLCAAWLEFARNFAGMEKSWKHCWKVWHFSFAPYWVWWQILLNFCIESKTSWNSICIEVQDVVGFVSWK